MREARSDELVTLTRSRHEALAIEDGHLLPATLNQPCLFHLPSSVRDRRPLYPEHFSEQILRDPHVSSSSRSRIINSQRAKRCFRLCAPLHAADTITCPRKARTYANVRRWNDGINSMARVNLTREIFAALPGICTKKRDEEVLAPKTACTPAQPSLPMVAISMMKRTACAARDKN